MSRKAFVSSLAAAIALVSIIGLAACKRKLTQPYVDPQQLGLDISFLGNHPQEIAKDSNLYIAGKVKDGNGIAQQGVRVYFQLNPDDIGVVTPYAFTDTTAESGFQTPVTFNGHTYGVTVIEGYVLDLNGNTTTKDTLHVLVGGSGNG
jgi:hypothetical protein